MLKNKGIASKLIVLILSSTAVIFISIFIYSYVFSRQIIIEKVEENAHNFLQATVNQIGIRSSSIEKVPKDLSCFLENSPYTKDALIKLIGALLKNNPEIYGIGIAFEPYLFDKNQLCFAPYFCRKEGEIKFSFVQYKYFYHDWYQIPKELNRPIWSNPYYGKAGGKIMSTYSVPFYKTVSGTRKLMGIVAVDISLFNLQKMVDSIKIAQSGYAFLLSRNGTFVTHPDKDLIMNQSIFDVAEARRDTRLRQIGRQEQYQ